MEGLIETVRADALWIATGVMIGLAILAGILERRRSRRRDLDDTGWMPWRGVQVAAMFMAAACAILAYRL